MGPLERVSFGPCKEYTARELRALDPIRQDQIVQTMWPITNVSYEGFDACVDALRERLGAQEDDPLLDYYAIHVEGRDEPVYEMWAYLGEAGIVFPVGRAEDTTVYCQQRFFWSVDPGDNEEAKLLANALNAADLKWQ